MLDMCCCLGSFKNLSVNISEQRGRALKTHGLSWNAWKYLAPALWGRETFPCEQFISVLAIALSVQILLLYSSSLFFLFVWSWKVLEKMLCTSWTLSSIWSRTIKLLKDLLILLNNFNNYMENCNSRMMINETEFLLVTELWNTLLMENVRVIVYIENNHPSSQIFTVCILQS